MTDNVEFCVRIKSCSRIPTKWNDVWAHLEILSGEIKLWNSPNSQIKDECADWPESGPDCPVYSFYANPSGNSVFGKKFLLKFKLLTIKDKKAQVVGKWKLDILGFLKKTDLITHSVKKGDSPKLNLNVIDVTELRKRGQIPSSLSFVENAGVQQIKKKTNFSGQLFRSKSHSSMSGDDELGSSPSQFGGLTKSNSRFSISTDQEGDYEISRQSNEEVFGENNSRSSFTDSLVDGCLKGNRDEGSVGDGGDGDSVTGNFCRSHSRSHSLGEESSVEEHQSHMKRSKKKSSNNVCHLGRGRISIGFERDDDGGTTARITTISRTLR
eukprot:TRINITY_DN10318_c0_g2_i1.p1 TRINITY_DN10318_c0_g2~~TRINITY_DN10318_c0_g2_i1.p1  ORF type:complete len:355 (+),score=69.97 TRINITY_DN10318_c0_g2_i1:92-1066(+)